MSLVLAGCDLLSPAQPQTFRLAAINGRPLPFTSDSGIVRFFLDSSRTTFETHLLVVRWVEGQVQAFGRTRLVWDATSDRLVDGKASPLAPAVHDHHAGSITAAGDSLEFANLFQVQFSDDGMSLRMIDETGAYGWVKFDFKRQ